MIIKAAKKYRVNLNKSFMIGDTKSDKICAERANLKFYYKKNNLQKDVKLILKNYKFK